MPDPTVTLTQDDFDQIRKLYFPRWDREQRWSFRVALAPGMIHGSFCDSRNRVIYVSPEDAADPLARMVLVHEISHAVTTKRHGKRFQERMLTAAERADKLGDTALAGQLREDAEKARRSFDIGDKSYVYPTIREWVLQSDDDLEFEDVRAALALEIGDTPERFDESYPRARRVFDQAVRDRAEDAAGPVPKWNGSSWTIERR